AMPKPCSKCCLAVARKPEFKIGFNVLRRLLVVTRLLLKLTDRSVPVRKPFENVKFANPVFWLSVLTPVRIVVDCGVCAFSHCSVPVRDGSSGSTAGPAPVVELTIPKLPVPAPPAPADVPPAPLP